MQVQSIPNQYENTTDQELRRIDDWANRWGALSPDAGIPDAYREFHQACAQIRRNAIDDAAKRVKQEEIDNLGALLAEAVRDGMIAQSIPPSRNRPSSPKPILCGTRGHYIDRAENCPPLPPSALVCPDKGWSGGQARCANGRPQMYAFDCGMDDCPVCLPEYQRGKAWRYQHGIGHGDQAIITLDCPDVETAHEVRKYLSGKFRVPHVSVATPYPDDDDRVTVTLILAETLSDVRMETAYQVINDRWRHLPLSMDIGPLPPSEFAEYIVTQHKIGGTLNPVSFAGGWVKDAPAEPDYQFSDPDTHTVFVEPFKESHHRCADCDAIYKQYPNGKNLSPATRAINAEKRNEVYAVKWLDGISIEYQDITDMAAGGECSAVYNRIRVRTRYSGPRSLIADTAAAIWFDPNCTSPDNPRGAYLPPDASLAMMVVMQHVSIGG